MLYGWKNNPEAKIRKRLEGMRVESEIRRKNEAKSKGKVFWALKPSIFCDRFEKKKKD